MGVCWFAVQITDNIIAMGLPCTGRTAMYRNPLTEVVAFLKKYHQDQYKLYNLCTRPKDLYDPEKFEVRVMRVSEREESSTIEPLRSSLSPSRLLDVAIPNPMLALTPTLGPRGFLPV